jgi:lysophospholipid acyltransferase (LPLAT)-like uncharacterized protein
VLEKIRQEIIACLGVTFLRLLVLTLRFRVHPISIDPHSAFRAPLGPHVLVFWHNRQLVMPFVYFRGGGIPHKISVLISQHRDGRLIARVMALLGVNSIAGSSTRGGTAALRGMVRVMREGNHVAITPDGPKGPLYEAKPGAVLLSSLSGGPLYPMAYGLEKAWVFKSWDRMILPKPFSKIVVAIAEPIKVPARLSEEQLEEYRVVLQNKLAEITTAVDSYDYA